MDKQVRTEEKMIRFAKGTAYIGIQLLGHLYLGIQHNRLVLRRLTFHGRHWWIGPFYIQV